MNESLSPESEEFESQSESQGEIRFSRAHSFLDKSMVIRLCLGLVFSLLLFVFFHFRETNIQILEVGQKAPQYIVAQVDFTFPDEELTIVSRQEAAFSIGTIYRLNDRQVQVAVTEIQKWIAPNGKGGQEWRTLAKETGFQDAALGLGLLNDFLSECRFSDARTLSHIESLPEDQLPLPLEYFFNYVPSRISSTVTLPDSFWENLKQREYLKRDLPIAVLTYFVQKLRPHKWEFEVDQGMEYSLRKLAKAQVSPKMTRVRAGERIINQGEKASSRHLAMLSAMKEQLAKQRDPFTWRTILGTALMVFLLGTVAILYLRETQKEIMRSNKRLALVITIFSLTILISKGVEFFLIHDSGQFFYNVHTPIFIPFASILLSSLLNTRLAAFGTIYLTVILTLGLAVDPLPFLLVNILTGIIVIYSNRKVKRRKEIFVVCAKAWLCAMMVICAIDLSPQPSAPSMLVSDLFSSLLFMLVTAVLVVGLIPIFEASFRIMTDITLMEFLDPSNELLRRLTIEAPGTYQHSVVVGNLAEASASAVGANGLFCRVATQYHDIGKLANPQYFTENQMGGMDMHQLLTPLESAQVIISHITEGVQLARKAGLPEQFIDVIKEHHGTTLVYYFYAKQLEAMGGDQSKVNKGDFRYGGPKPRSKESTIIMISDTMEAASRCLDEFNEESVRDMVETLIQRKLEDGQFDNSLLTFEELGVIKSVLIKTLLAASHPRIKYPPHHPGEEG
jgi:cyclic-di-AMP phosphodiesterase PgpH